MVSFFERRGQFIRCETYDRPDGAWQLLIVEADGTERIEEFATPDALDDRLREVEHDFKTCGWFGPYGRRS
jgi:hypothetical protein